MNHSAANKAKLFVRTGLMSGKGGAGTISNQVRSNLSEQREALKAYEIPIFLNELKRCSPITAPLHVGSFPNKISGVKNSIQLPGVGIDKEFLWTSTIVSWFAEKINAFIKQREKFYHSYLFGRYPDAINILDEIEKSFGLSLWSLEARIKLYSLNDDKALQELHLEEILQSKKRNAIVAYFCYRHADLCREGSSLRELMFDLNQLLAPSAGLRDYMIFRLVPHLVERVEDPANCITCEESSPIIDRYDTLLDMIKLELVRSEETRPDYVVQTLRILDKIEDPRITTLRRFVLGNPVNLDNLNEKLLSAHQLYLVGDYKRSLDCFKKIWLENKEIECIELPVRTAVHGEAKVSFFPPKCLLERIAKCMTEVINVSAKFSASHLELDRLSILTIRSDPPPSIGPG